MKPEIGKIYVIAARGEMKCAEEMEGGHVFMFWGHGWGRYWAGPDEVVREANAEDLKRRDAQARPRGVACDDGRCWCHEILGQKLDLKMKKHDDCDGPCCLPPTY